MCVGKIEQLTENKSSLSGTTIEDLIKENQKLTDRNQRLTLALLDISNDMIQRAKNGKKKVKEKRMTQMSDDEAWNYYDNQEKTWTKRKQSYLFIK